MIKKKDYARVRRELEEHLRTRFTDITAEIGDNIFYKGTNIVLRSTDFEGLLAEQRFHHVAYALPKEVYENYLQGGSVCFELTPQENGQDLMKMPRAEDVADDQARILDQLKRIRFFSRLQQTLGASPHKASTTHFELTRCILTEGGSGEEDTTRACLLMILLGAYCDADVLGDLAPQYAPEEGGD